MSISAWPVLRPWRSTAIELLLLPPNAWPTDVLFAATLRRTLLMAARLEVRSLLCETRNIGREALTLVCPTCELMIATALSRRLSRRLSRVNVGVVIVVAEVVFSANVR